MWISPYYVLCFHSNTYTRAEVNAKFCVSKQWLLLTTWHWRNKSSQVRKKTNKSPHAKQKGRGELGKDLLFTEAGPGGSDGSGQSASLSPAWWLILVRVSPGCWKCVCVCGVDRGGSWELTEKREMPFSVKRLLTTEQAALVPWQGSARLRWDAVWSTPELFRLCGQDTHPASLESYLWFIRVGWLCLCTVVGSTWP